MIMLLFTCIELSYDLINVSLPIVGKESGFGTDVIGTALSAYFLIFTLFQIPLNNALKKMKKRYALILMGTASLIPCSLLLLDIPPYLTILIMGGIGLTWEVSLLFVRYWLLRKVRKTKREHLWAFLIPSCP